MRSAAETTSFAQILVAVCAVGVVFLSLCPEFNLLSQLEGEKNRFTPSTPDEIIKFCCKSSRSHISDLRSSDEIRTKSRFEMKVTTAEWLMMSSEMLTG